MSDQEAVKSFLKELQQLVNIFGILFLDRRPKNNVQHLADLGITAKRREEIIKELKVDDYSEGPLDETQMGGTEMWVFGKVIKKQEVYIKLTISRETSKTICISFHKAEHPMDFPFKK